jgi:hypothetical protein
MPHVIIGHTTGHSVRVWVKGDASSTTCQVTLRPAPGHQPGPVLLAADNDYTGVVTTDGLEPDREYVVVAHFSPSGMRARGRVRTFKTAPGSNAAVPFSFVLSSCNLSIVSINDFLARLAATAGASLAMSSLDVAAYRWRKPKSQALQSLIRPLGKLALGAIAKGIERATGLKQTGSTYLRSPFLKLAAIFESSIVDLPLPRKPERNDSRSDADHLQRLDEYSRKKRELFLAVGDFVESSHGSTGVIASISDDEAKALRRVVLTHVDGKFVKSAVLFRHVVDGRKKLLRRVAPILAVRTGRSWYEPPSFFIHAGDQIYYDFPDPERAPKAKEYRLAYHEAWFEDDALRHLLASWPHYMTLDDHEIVDQFARDFQSPTKYSPGDYLLQSTKAYRQYPHALNPPGENGKEARNCGPFWFTFEKGATRFFVMDTRTHRRNRRGEIIDREQMDTFLAWLSEHRTALKFVVTSVPFVAELNRGATEAKQDWYDPRRNSEQDKWTAPEFKAQRERIIEYIALHRIEHLVFLTGDMHCCYHATMRIGEGPTAYESTVVHELAGGPVNQLQLAKPAEFERHCRARTEGLTADQFERLGQTGTERGTLYEVTLERFHGDVSAVMHVKVDYVGGERLPRVRPTKEESNGDDAAGHVAPVVPEVEWNVIRTLTDPGPAGWLDGDAAQEAGPAVDATDIRTGEAVMSGRISFARRRLPQELVTW